jgi:hypothetical protein
MPRHFGLHAFAALDRDERWAWWLIAGSELAVIGVGIFIA